MGGLLALARFRSRAHVSCTPSTDAGYPPLQATLLFGATVLYTTLLSGPASFGAGAAGGAGLLLGAGAGAAAAAWPTVGGIALPVVLFAGAGRLGRRVVLHRCVYACMPGGHILIGIQACGRKRLTHV